MTLFEYRSEPTEGFERLYSMQDAVVALIDELTERGFVNGNPNVGMYVRRVKRAILSEGMKEEHRLHDVEEAALDLADYLVVLKLHRYGDELSMKLRALKAIIESGHDGKGY